MDARSSSGRLSRFRKNLYGCLRRRADALFELIDAMLVVGAVSSPPHLSLAPVHRRGWGSLYAALSKGRIDEDALRNLLVRHPLAGSTSGRSRAVGLAARLVVDVRPGAEQVGDLIVSVGHDRLLEGHDVRP